MKKVLMLLLCLTLGLVQVNAATKPYDSSYSLEEEIDPYQTWIYSFTRTELSLVRIFVNPTSDSLSYSFILRDINGTDIILRSSVEGESIYYLIWEDFLEIRISNPNGITFVMSVIIDYEILAPTESNGYTFVSEDNWCTQVSVKENESVILSIKDLTKGDFDLRLMALGIGGSLTFHLTNHNPSKNENWSEDAVKIEWEDFEQTGLLVGRWFNWVVIESNDYSDHEVVLVFLFDSPLGAQSIDFVIGIVLGSALFMLLFLQMRKQKKRRPSAVRYGTRNSRRDIQNKLHLSSQVDIRHEGTRYMYIPPDVLDRSLIEDKEVLEDKKKKKKDN